MSANEDRDRELPLAKLPDIPLWSENYAWDAYDPVSGVWFFLSIGRWYRDPAMWREFVGVCIDGKTCYSRRNIGRLPDPKLVGASCLQIECMQPLQRWQLRYHGAALKCGLEQLIKHPPLDGEASLLEFDLQWDAACPLIDFGHGTEPGAASSHVEQGGIAKGRFTIDGKTYPFEGRSFRDHSRGTRNHREKFHRHSWIHGTFPSGRSISSLTLQSPDLTIALASLFVVSAAGEIHKFQFDEPLLWDTWEGREQPYAINARDGNSEAIKIEAAPLFSYPLTIATPSDVFVGQSNSFGGWRVFEMPTRLSWDGEETWGLTEISLTTEKSALYPAG